MFGRKVDLVPRMAARLNPKECPDHRVLPTIKTIKIALWLLRTKDLRGRARIKWSDVNNHSGISMWIETWISGRMWDFPEKISH